MAARSSQKDLLNRFHFCLLSKPNPVPCISIYETTLGPSRALRSLLEESLLGISVGCRDGRRIPRVVSIRRYNEQQGYWHCGRRHPRDFKMTAPLKWARQYPSTSSRYILQFPVSATTPALPFKIKECGSDEMVLAPTTAVSTSVNKRLVQAR